MTQPEPSQYAAEPAKAEPEAEPSEEPGNAEPASERPAGHVKEQHEMDQHTEVLGDKEKVTFVTKVKCDQSRVYI